MTSETKDSFEQFNSLINGDMPEEYKDMLKKLQEQGVFYHQFIQNINTNNSNLSAFWDLPTTLGFNTSANIQPDWLKPIVDISCFGLNSATSTERLSQLANEVFQRTQVSLKKFQEASATIEILHAELSQLAMKYFQELQTSSGDTSNEQLCNDWLKAGEQAFDEISQRSDYIESQQALFISLSELKSSQNTVSEQLTTLFGLPSQQDLQDLQKGLHQLRLEFAEYKEITDATISELSNTIQKLTS